MKISFRDTLEINTTPSNINKFDIPIKDQQYDGYEIPVDIVFDVHYDQGRLYGPPEDSYPAESSCELVSIAYNGNELDYMDIKKSELERLEEEAWDYYREMNESRL